MNKVINPPKKPIKSSYAHISALRGITCASPHWILDSPPTREAGPAADGLDVDRTLSQPFDLLDAKCKNEVIFIRVVVI